MILGTGIDITEISRVQNMLERYGEDFWERILAPEERGIEGSYKRRLEYLAGRYAAKEAASKALGTGIGKVGFHQMVILPNEHGAPQLTLREYAAEVANQKGVTHLHISITHSDHYAVAQVILEGHPLS